MGAKAARDLHYFAPPLSIKENSEICSVSGLYFQFYFRCLINNLKDVYNKQLSEIAISPFEVAGCTNLIYCLLLLTYYLLSLGKVA